jgi:hypothetical protein
VCRMLWTLGSTRCQAWCVTMVCIMCAIFWSLPRGTGTCLMTPKCPVWAAGSMWSPTVWLQSAIPVLWRFPKRVHVLQFSLPFLNRLCVRQVHAHNVLLCE